MATEIGQMIRLTVLETLRFYPVSTLYYSVEYLDDYTKLMESYVNNYDKIVLCRKSMDNTV